MVMAIGQKQWLATDRVCGVANSAREISRGRAKLVMVVMAW